MKKKIIAIIAVILVIIIVTIVSVNIVNSKNDLIEIKSEKELQKVSNSYSSEGNEIAAFVISPYVSLGFAGLFSSFSGGIATDLGDYSGDGGYNIPTKTTTEADTGISDWDSLKESASEFIESGATLGTSSSASSDYSKTNVQVENVDEADIVKTDGEYVYSLSKDTVYITYARNAVDMAVVSKIEESESNMYPEDLIIQNNKLIVISGNSDQTIVRIYDLTDKAYPKKIKQFELYKEYYTSRFLN